MYFVLFVLVSSALSLLVCIHFSIYHTHAYLTYTQKDKNKISTLR